MPKLLSAALALTLLPALAHAQPKVTVVEKSGVETKGKLVLLDTKSVVLLVNGQQRSFDLAGVRLVEQRGDSLKNGALMGVAVGFLGGLLIGSLGQCEPPEGVVVDCKSPSRWSVALKGALIYGAISTAIDALIQGRKTLYESPTGSAAMALRPASIAFRIRW